MNTISRYIKKLLGVKKMATPPIKDSPKEELRSIFTKDFFPAYEIGNYTYGKPNVLEQDSTAKLVIGRYCSIADDVSIFLGGEHHTDWVTTYPFSTLWNHETNYTNGHPITKGDVIIGNDVWIGRGVFIMSGIRIGDGAVIGAGSVVTKEVFPYSIVAGNPARLIRHRFSNDVIEKLLLIKWWNWNEVEVLKALPLLLDNKVLNFVEYGLSKLKE